LLFQKRRVRKI